MLNKKALSIFISFQIALSPVVGLSEEKERKSQDDEFHKVASDVEHGNVPALTQNNFWGLAGQYVEVYEGHPQPIYTYPLDRLQTDRARLGFTSLKPYFDKEKGCLAIEASRGHNESGENGKVVARQYFPVIREVSAFALDNELLSIIDNRGNLHVIDWGLLRLQAFRSLAQIHLNVWSPLSAINLDSAKVEASYITAGLRPFDENDLIENAVVPRNQSGEMEIEAGDLIVKVDGKVFGVFSRRQSHETIGIGQQYLLLIAQLKSQNVENNEDLAKAYTKVEQEHEAFISDMTRIEDSTKDPMIEFAIRAISPDRLSEIKSRIADQQRYQKRNVDYFDMSEWRDAFNQIEAQAQLSNPGLSAEELANQWQRYLPKRFVEPEEKPDLIRDYLNQKWTWTRERAEGASEKFWLAAKLASAAVVVAGVMAAPAVYESNPNLQQIAILQWMYEHYPAVLKDAGYRWPLIASSLSLTAIWPAGLISSWLSGKTLSFMSSQVQNSNSRFAGYVRDLARDWAPMTNWQRITSFGMRFYAEIVLAPWIQAIEKLGRQKTLFAALTAGVSPRAKVKKDSPLGQQYGLETDSYVGLVTPGYGPNYEHKIDQKRGLIAELAKQNRQLREHTWLLAAMAVSERYNVDLATLMTAQSDQLAVVKLEDLQAILKNENARAEWELVADELNREISRLPFDATADDAVSTLDREEFARQYQLAKDTAERLVKLDRFRTYLKKLKIRSARKARAFKEMVLNIGREQYSFLKSVVTNEFVYNQVEREFISDHLIVVYQVALIGERANLSAPDVLAASANGLLWTTPQHLQDVGYNTYVHFFLAGASLALVFQQLNAEDETNYKPRELVADVMPVEPELSRLDKITLKVHDKMRRVLRLPPRAEGREGKISPAREERLFPGLRDFTSDLIRPWHSNMGGLMVSRLKRMAQTFSAFVTMTVIMRLGLGGQNFHDAALGTAICLFAQQWYYGWVWDPVQRGNKMYETRYAEITERLAQARLKLQWGLRELQKDHLDKAENLLNEGHKEITRLYRELNPEALVDIDPTQTIDNLARQYLELSEQTAPGALAPNSKLLWLTVVAGAVSSTYLAVSLTTMTNNPAYLSWELAAEWLGKSALLYSLCWVFLGNYSYDNWWGFRHVKNAVEDWREKRLQKRISTSCEKELE